MARKRIERNIAYDEGRQRYYVNFDFGKDPDSGKQIKKTVTYTKLKDARAALRKHEAQRDEGQIVLPRDLTLAQWLKQWMDSVVKLSRAVTTVYAYEHMLQGYIIPLLGDIPLQKLTPLQLQDYYATLMREKGLSSNTARKHHDFLNAALKMAVRQGILNHNPAQLVEAPKVLRPEIRFYTLQEVHSLLKLSEGTKVEVLIKLAALLGLRREEILGLTWDCVDFDLKKIEIRRVRTAAGSIVVNKQPKTATSRRTLYMPDELEDTLRRAQEKQQQYRSILGTDYYQEDDAPAGYVFAHEDGRPVRPNYASDLFTQFIQSHGLPHITLHGLRHSFASIANAMGMPMFDIGKALGHSSSATTSKVYTHLMDQDHRMLLERMWKSDDPAGT